MPSWGVGRRGHWEPGRMTLPCGRQRVASSNVWGRPEPRQPAPLDPAHRREYRVQAALGGGPIRTRLWPQRCGSEAMLLIHSSLSKEPEWSSAQREAVTKLVVSAFWSTVSGPVSQLSGTSSQSEGRTFSQPSGTRNYCV